MVINLNFRGNVFILLEKQRTKFALLCSNLMIHMKRLELEFILFTNKRVVERGYVSYPHNEYTIYVSGLNLETQIKAFFNLIRPISHGISSNEIYSGGHLIGP